MDWILYILMLYLFPLEIDPLRYPSSNPGPGDHAAALKDKNTEEDFIS